MSHRHLLPSSLLLFALACGGAEKPVAEATLPAPVDTAASGHLAIVPFVMTSTGTKPDGTTKVRVIRGTADGLISVDEEGVSKEIATITSDGTFAKLDADSSESLRIDEAGTFHVDGKAMTQMRIGDDGTLFRGSEALLRIEDGKVIDVTGELLKSTFSFNGETRTTTYEITIEGGDEAKHIAGVVLGLQMLPGKLKEEPAVESGSAPEMAPEPAAAPNPTP